MSTKSHPPRTARAAAPPPKPRKVSLVALRQIMPWDPLTPDAVSAAVFQALQRGDAEPEQQQKVVKLILTICGNNQMSFHPGEDGRRATDFAEGKRFVGQQVIGLLNVDLAELRRATLET